MKNTLFVVEDSEGKKRNKEDIGEEKGNLIFKEENKIEIKRKI